MKLQNIIVGVSLILLAFAYRFIPNLPNFSPVTATFLFGGAVLVKKYKGIIGLLAILIVSDFILNNTLLRGFYPEVEGIVWFSEYMIFTVISYVLIFVVGSRLVEKNSFIKIILGSFLASAIFFLLTNIGAWVFDPFQLYPNNFAGLLTAIAAGIPFYQNSFIADLVFSGVLFGSYYAITHMVSQPKELRA